MRSVSKHRHTHHPPPPPLPPPPPTPTRHTNRTQRAANATHTVRRSSQRECVERMVKCEKHSVTREAHVQECNRDKAMCVPTLPSVWANFVSKVTSTLTEQNPVTAHVVIRRHVLTNPWEHAQLSPIASQHVSKEINCLLTWNLAIKTNR